MFIFVCVRARISIVAPLVETRSSPSLTPRDCEIDTSDRGHLQNSGQSHSFDLEQRFEWNEAPERQLVPFQRVDNVPIDAPPTPIRVRSSHPHAAHTRRHFARRRRTRVPPGAVSPPAQVSACIAARAPSRDAHTTDDPNSILEAIDPNSTKWGGRRLTPTGTLQILFNLYFFMRPLLLVLII